MTYKIDEIEGIGPANKEKLSAAQIETTDDLLSKCCDPAGRKATAASTGIGESQLLTWANMADLMRISGVGKQYAELLVAAGVDTVKELRQRNAANLSATMKEINDQKNLAKTSPSESMVTDFIAKAKETEPLITH